MPDSTPLETAIVAVPETAGSALYGMVDVLRVTGNVCQTLMRADPTPPPFRVRVVGVDRARFCCGNGIPVEPSAGIHEIDRADVVILPELWLGPDEHLSGRYPALIEWIRARHQAGACVYSVCSGALMLAETGLLNGFDATSGSLPEKVDGLWLDFSGMVWRHGQEGRHAEESVYGSADRRDPEGSGWGASGGGAAAEA